MYRGTVLSLAGFFGLASFAHGQTSQAPDAIRALVAKLELQRPLSIAKACDFLLKSILDVVGFGFALLIFRLVIMNISTCHSNTKTAFDDRVVTGLDRPY